MITKVGIFDDKKTLSKLLKILTIPTFGAKRVIKKTGPVIAFGANFTKPVQRLERPQDTIVSAREVHSVCKNTLS